MESVRKLDRFAQGAKCDQEERYWRWASFLSPERTSVLLRDPLSKEAMEEFRGELFQGLSFDRMEDLLQVDRSFVLPNDMLTKVDRMSMASGLEVRVPFLDPDCVSLAESLPGVWRIDRKEQKLLLKRAFQDLLPKGVMERPKHGFELPLADLLRNTYEGELVRLSEPALLEEQAIFAPVPVKNMIETLRKGKSRDNGAAVWSFLVFQKWWERHFL
jgi:asparagine synthase (glutamine-hydrolysing)